MQQPSKNIVDSVLNLVLSQNRDPQQLTLEEAKQMTLQILREERRRQQAPELTLPGRTLAETFQLRQALPPLSLPKPKTAS
ncbi:MAG: hypothetical protein RIK87_01620 [Fuerstiella sp.]